MRFKWTGTVPESLTLSGKEQAVSSWWDVYLIFAEKLVAGAKPIPPKFLRNGPGRGLRLSSGQLLNTNLCFDDVIRRIQQLAELNGETCWVQWSREDGATGRLDLWESFGDSTMPPPPPRSKIMVIVFDTETVRNDPDLVQATLQSALNL